MNNPESPEPVALPPGTYYRRVVVIPEPGRVRAALEDENHRVEMIVTHDGKSVTGVTAATPRIPYNTCPGAEAKLTLLEGMTLRRMHETTGQDSKLQCTHMFDLARLAIARALIDTPVQYDVAVPDRVEKRTRAELLRDGKPFLTWDVERYTVTGPDPFTGHFLNGAPIWPEGLDADLIEAGLVMRRVLLISQVREPMAASSRTPGMPNTEVLQILRNGLVGRCHTWQHGVIEGATTNYSWRNLSDHRENLLAGFPGVRTLAALQA